MPNITESQRLRYAEQVSDLKSALKQRVPVAAWQAERDQLAHDWTMWWRRKMDQGHDVFAVLTDAMAELQMRNRADLDSKIDALKAELKKALR
jgi:hypothetical protein